ncbi:MAG TPA: hypothetical protein VFU21_02065 [Kofleriaceae bacterium]|nr:hypothetical protein [Kofleriaceae bacterium]
MKLNRFWMSAALAGALACDSIEGVEPDEAASASVGGEEDLGGDGRPFRPADGGFRAAGAAHEALVAGGTIRVTPPGGQPVDFATAAIARGAVAADSTARGTEITPGGALAIDRGVATEMLENREDGLEQSWRFAAEPDGAGDLVVEVAVPGQVAVDTTDEGLHFTAAGLTYSHALWVDAGGTRWEIPVSWEAGRIAMRVPDAVLTASEYPALLDPTISAATAIEGLILGGYTGAKSREPAIAWSGSRYLVAWRDDRAGSDSDIYVARVESDGVVVDRRGILVSNTTAVLSRPAVAWTGSAWLVAWTRSGRDIAAARVSPTGVVTQLGDVAATAATEIAPAFAADGGSGFLVWQADGDVRGARFDGAAFGAPVAIAATGDPESAPAIAGRTGGGYLVTWQAGPQGAEDIRAQLVDGAGALSGSAFAVTAAAGRQLAPATAFHGSGFMIAWTQGNDIWATTVSPLGEVAAAAEISATPTSEGNAALACDQAACLVSWQDRRDTVELTTGVYGRRVGFDLSLLGEEIEISDPIRNQLAPAVAAAASGFTVVWQDFRTGLPAATLTPIGTSGAVAEPSGVIVNRSAYNLQTRPVSVRSPNGHLILWSDSRNAGDDVMGRRFSPSGARLDDAALVVSSAAFDQTAPAVDFDGQSYLAVWADNRNSSRYDIYAARVAPDGTLLDGGAFPVSTTAHHQLSPDVASGDGVSLAVWQDRSNGTDYDLVGALITPDGAVSAAEIAICRQDGQQRRAAVTWDPASAQFVVVWADSRSANDEDIYAARVATDGSVLDACGVAVTTAPGSQSAPAIAVAGGQILVTWDDRGADESGDITGARIDATDGIAILDPAGLALATGAGTQEASTVVGVSEGRFSLAWVDDRNQQTAATDLYGNTVMPDGTLAGADYLISGEIDAESAPSFEINRNSPSKTYLVYERTKPTTGTTRVRRRWITY